MIKRYIAVIFAALVTLCGLNFMAAASTLDTGITGFTITAAAEFTNPVTTEDVDVGLARRLESLIKGGTRIPSSGIPQNAEELAKISVRGGITVSGEYTIHRSDALLYLSAGGWDVWTISDLEKDFYDLLVLLPGFYKHRDIPEAKLGENLVPVHTSDYIYRRLDNQFYKQGQMDGPRLTVEQVGDLPFIPTFDQKTSSVFVTIKQGNRVLLNEADANVASAHMFDVGRYEILIQANFSDPNYLGKVTYRYELDVTQSTMFAIRGGDAYPGEVVVLHARNVASASQINMTTNLNFKPQFFPDGNGGQIALLPISYVTAPGEHFVQMSANGVSRRFGIRSSDRTFQIQNMTVSQSTAQQTILSNEANAEFSNTFLPLRWESDNVRHWDGRFVMPVQDPYRLTTEFGAIRRVNNATETTRHSGIDMAAPTGTPIYASGAGRVQYAGYLKLTGNSVLIEHGYGLKTWYYHMDSLSTKTGDMVKAGQEIGKMGTTGFSTGPHLHFGMSVFNIYINPFTAINTDLLVME